MIESRTLADTLLGAATGSGLVAVFGTVTDASVPDYVRFRADSMESGDVGPFYVVTGKLKVGDRAMAAYLPDNKVWVAWGKAAGAPCGPAGPLCAEYHFVNTLHEQVYTLGVSTPGTGGGGGTLYTFTGTMPDTGGVPGTTHAYTFSYTGSAEFTAELEPTSLPYDSYYQRANLAIYAPGDWDGNYWNNRWAADSGTGMYRNVASGDAPPTGVWTVVVYDEIGFMSPATDYLITIATAVTPPAEIPGPDVVIPISVPADGRRMHVHLRDPSPDNVDPAWVMQRLYCPDSWTGTVAGSEAPVFSESTRVSDYYDGYNEVGVARTGLNFASGIETQDRTGTWVLVITPTELHTPVTIRIATFTEECCTLTERTIWSHPATTYYNPGNPAVPLLVSQFVLPPSDVRDIVVGATVAAGDHDLHVALYEPGTWNGVVGDGGEYLFWSFYNPISHHTPGPTANPVGVYDYALPHAIWRRCIGPARAGLWTAVWTCGWHVHPHGFGGVDTPITVLMYIALREVS